jgi:hypothetical protein
MLQTVLSLFEKSEGGKSGQHRASYFLTGRLLVIMTERQRVPQKTNYLQRFFFEGKGEMAG